MKSCIAIVLTIILTTGIMAPTLAAKDTVIVVKDYTGDAGWSAFVEQGVRNVSEAMPRGYRLEYRNMHTAMDCWDMTRMKKSGVVSVCFFDRPNEQAALASGSKNRIWIARDMLLLPQESYWDDKPPGANYVWTICHELMHSLTRVGDYYQYGHAEPPHPDTDCLWGFSPTPGPHDKKLLQQAFKKGKNNGKKGKEL